MKGRRGSSWKEGAGLVVGPVAPIASFLHDVITLEAKRELADLLMVETSLELRERRSAGAEAMD